MTKQRIESYTIESEAEADAYLKDLFADPRRRSMDEVATRANSLIPGELLRDYFPAQAEKWLSSRDGKIRL